MQTHIIKNKNNMTHVSKFETHVSQNNNKKTWYIDTHVSITQNFKNTKIKSWRDKLVMG